MQLSWSHKLFLRINEQIGKKPAVDRFMRFCGEVLIWILFFGFCFLFLFGIFEKSIGLKNIEIIIFSFLIAYSLSYTIAYLFPHARPIKELSQVKSLFRTLGTWKSFPSDHTIAVFLFTFLAWSFFGAEWGIIFLVGAILVASGRVYGGVHYPRDIVGGISLAVLAWFISILIYPHLF